jgi:hypothetical protein
MKGDNMKNLALIFLLLSVPAQAGTTTLKQDLDLVTTPKQAAPPQRANLILKDGTKLVALGRWEIRPPVVIFTAETGDHTTALRSIRLAEIDLEATATSNDAVPPPSSTVITIGPEGQKYLGPEAQRKLRLEDKARFDALSPELQAQELLAKEREKDRRAVARLREDVYLLKLYESIGCYSVRDPVARELCKANNDIGQYVP